MASVVFHQVTGANEQYLTVKGAGIKTGDHFQVYIPDLTVAEASLSDVSSQLRNIMSKLNKQEVIGGFLFAGRYVVTPFLVVLTQIARRSWRTSRVTFWWCILPR
ncbi:hypothetical protein YC2023_026054 [Brassica napus]|uniref:(rape) hypothetical protein n=1 Tax=Brassica napus TaxID=3708 RepID=A0A816XDQ2_BRANA|nr:unnamed protein product [Brassica napus]